MPTSRRNMMKLNLLAASALLLARTPIEAERVVEDEEEESWLWFPPGPMTFKKTGKDTGGTTSWIVGAIPPMTGNIFHKHTHEDEMFYVLAGKFEIEVASQSKVGGPGVCVYGPRQIPHRFTNVGTEPGRLLTVFTPAGLENWFQSLGVPVKAPGDRPQVDMAVLMAKIQASAASYGIIKTGEPKYPHAL